MNQETFFTHARSAVFGGVLFLAFVLAGSAYIIWAKLANMPAFQVTTVPLVLMILYAATLALARYFRLRDDQAGDNLYYLGFLYTLTSLGVTLWQFKIEEGGEQIVTNFGVAIASTILGVALRVVFNQMRQDPVEVERVARLELADAARRVKGELDAATFEFSSFRRSIQQILQENLRETREMFERLAKEIFDGLKTIPERSAEPLTTASKQSKDTLDKLAANLIEQLQSVGQKLTTQEEKIATATAGVASSLQELEQRLKTMQSPDGIIEIKLQPFIRGFTKAVNDQSKATGEQMAELQKVIGQFDQSVRQLSENMAAATRDRAADQHAAREFAGKTHADAAESLRLLKELEKRISASQPVTVERPEVSRGWGAIFRGGPS